MPTDQLAAFDGGTLLPRPGRGGALGRALSRLAAMGGRRHARQSVHDLGDHLLADIGLQRDLRTQRGSRASDPRLLVQRLP